MIPRDYLDRRVYWGWIRSGFYPESKWHFAKDPVLHEITNPSKRFKSFSIWNPLDGVLTFSFWFEYKMNEIEFEIINSLNSKLKQKNFKMKTGYV